MTKHEPHTPRHFFGHWTPSAPASNDQRPPARSRIWPIAHGGLAAAALASVVRLWFASDYDLVLARKVQLLKVGQVELTLLPPSLSVGVLLLVVVYYLLKRFKPALEDGDLRAVSPIELVGGAGLLSALYIRLLPAQFSWTTACVGATAVVLWSVTLARESSGKARWLVLGLVWVGFVLAHEKLLYLSEWDFWAREGRPDVFRNYAWLEDRGAAEEELVFKHLAKEERPDQMYWCSRYCGGALTGQEQTTEVRILAHSNPPRSLRFARLRALNLEGVLFRKVDFRGARFSGGWFKAAVFLGCDLRGARFSATDLTSSHICGSDLRGVSFLDNTELKKSEIVEQVLGYESEVDGFVDGDTDFSGANEVIFTRFVGKNVESAKGWEKMKNVRSSVMYTDAEQVFGMVREGLQRRSFAAKCDLTGRAKR